MIRIIPKKDLKVMNPSTNKRVPDEGVVISKITTYWKRREDDGDITITKVIAKKPNKKKEGDK